MLRNAKHYRDSIAIEVLGGRPCKKPVKYSVVAGYGKFIGATGSGTVLFTCKKHYYSDQWTGTLKY